MEFVNTAFILLASCSQGVHLFNKYLLITYYVLGPTFVMENTTVHQIHII